MKLRSWQLALLLLVMAWGMATEVQAREISRECMSDSSEWNAYEILLDGNPYVRHQLGSGAYFTLSHPEGIGSIYLIFDEVPGEYSVTDNDTGHTYTRGTQGFLHEFAELAAEGEDAPSSVTITFGDGPVWLNEMHVFTPGPVPDWVQKWEAPTDERADILLFSAHCDDEQLFFAGVLPYYAGELDYRVQVVYMTDHKSLYSWRVHEGLDGLWNVGVRRYPVFGPFHDAYSRSRHKAYENYLADGVTDRDLAAFVTEQVRRFRPLVVLSHDINGEYGHGQHMTTADAVMAAAISSGSAQHFPDSVERYGVWEVPKVYLHLYPLNQVWLDWDQPLEHFGGMTAYEVTRDIGFPSHTSQVDGFAWYMRGSSTAAEIELYSPCIYGLYRSTVGEDAEKNNLFEHLINYDQQDRLAQEAAQHEAARQEAARQEAARLEEQASAEAQTTQEAVLTVQVNEEDAPVHPHAPLLSLLLLSAALTALAVRGRKNF